MIGRFLQLLAEVVRRGVRKDYVRVEGHERFLKGQLQLSKQLRQSPSQQTHFHIEYDVYSENRAENRLIRTALRSVFRWSEYLPHQRLARELTMVFENVPYSQHIASDFTAWRTSRDMHYYQPLLPWLRLILNQQSPFAIAGAQEGISFLFPMEKLFEKYVARSLQNFLRAGYSLKTQLSRYALAHQLDKPVFWLQPDIVIFHNDTPAVVIDTKWKLLDATASYAHGALDPKAGISQQDMYQLYAYGRKYLGGCGKLMLIYPQWEKFSQQLAPFMFEPKCELFVVPCDLAVGDMQSMRQIIDTICHNDLYLAAT